MEQIERIKKMEQRFNRASAAVKKLTAALDKYLAVQNDMMALDGYYGSEEWKQDYADDEAGRLPADLKRGVLSEDGIWNLLADARELKKTMARMKMVLFFIIPALMAVSVRSWGQTSDTILDKAPAPTRVISGIVSDVSTGKAVARANVTAGKWSVVTNDDGLFTLKTDGTASSVTVSHVGYQPLTLSIPSTWDGQSSPFRIRLRPTTIQLKEILVMADNARELVEKAISRIPTNYSQQAELFRCFYRETAMKRQHYICVAEGVVDMYKTDYQHTTQNDKVAIKKGRRLLSPKQSDTLSVKVLGGPVTPIALDLVKNPDFLLNREELDCYHLKLEVPTSINDRMQYVVSIAPRRSMPYALYHGKLFIDQNTLAFTRAELTLDVSNREKATQMMLVRKPAGVRFRPKELSLLVDYQLGSDGVTRISYLRTTFRFNCDWKRRLFATSFAAFCEMVVTQRSTLDSQHSTPIRGRDSFDQHDAFYDKVDYFRDPAFWQNYNVIEPSESLDRAVHRLLKKY